MRIVMEDTRRIAVTQVEILGGAVRYEGSARIDGVAETFS
ncbi:MAG: hypothetical protein ACYCST_18870 [Acidimicrobiales bacterium]